MEVLPAFVFLGDEAFALPLHIMTPFLGTQQKSSQWRIYNFRHSRARRVDERSFEILSVFFRYLHNFLRKGQSSSSYCPPGTFDSEDTFTGELIPGTWRVEDQPNGTLLRLKRIPRKPSVLGKEIREDYFLFFTSEKGKVPWQNNY
nr:unnamed protein product [Callosobruchus analis]